jgi:KipI family sensor histidine kinase inhibitor
MPGRVSAARHLPVRVLPMGDAALLLETEDVDAVLALRAALAPLVAAGEGVWAQVEELVPGARTLLLVARPTTPLDEVRDAVLAATAHRPPDSAPGGAARRGAAPGGSAPEEGIVEVPVRYDGADLADVGTMTGLGVAGVVAAHTGTPWRVGFGGFAPGFAYLVGGDPRLAVPRRDEPRTRVPAGAVALAGGFSGIYPRASPGGWQLIGTTDLALWDADREPPALLRPGTTVRFVEVRP